MKKTQANEQQLRQALATHLKHAETQNLALNDLSKRVGKAGNLIEKIKKLVNKNDPNAISAIKALIDKFESKPKGRGAATNNKRGVCE